MRILLLVKLFQEWNNQTEYCRKIIETQKENEFLILTAGDCEGITTGDNYRIYKGNNIIRADNFYNWTMVINNSLSSAYAMVDQDFDIIHCNDWECFPTALAIKEKTGKPLVTTLHSTEETRGWASPYSSLVKDMEKEACDNSDELICMNEKIREHTGKGLVADAEKTIEVYNKLCAS